MKLRGNKLKFKFLVTMLHFFENHILSIPKMIANDTMLDNADIKYHDHRKFYWKGLSYPVSGAVPSLILSIKHTIYITIPNILLDLHHLVKVSSHSYSQEVHCLNLT